jgi:hypothetical protein
VKVVGGSEVVMPEGLVEEKIASAGIVGKTESVAHDQEVEGLPEGRLPVESFGGTWSRLNGLDVIELEFVSRDSEIWDGRSWTGGK